MTVTTAAAPVWLTLGWSLAVAWLATTSLVRIAGPTRDRPGASGGSSRADGGGRRRRRPSPRAVGLAAAPALVAGVVVLGVWATLLAGTALVLRRWSRAASRQRRERGRVAAEMPGVVELLVLTVRAGMTVHQSVRVLSTTAPEAVRPGFAAVVHRLDRGVPLADALAALPVTLGPAAAVVADTLGPADRYGLPLAPALEQLAGEARAARRRFLEADARQLPVRLSLPLVTCTLPAFVLLAIVPALLAAISSLGGHLG